jgi:hypothetical protein
MSKRKVKKKVALFCLGISVEFETTVLVGKTEKIDYKPKKLNIASFVATGMGLKPKTICRHGKEVTQCMRCSRKQCPHGLTIDVFSCKECGGVGGLL